MRRAARGVVAAAVGLCLAVAGPPARAQRPADVATARDLFLEAHALVQKGDWDGARRAFAASLQLKRAPLTMYSLGVAEKSSGHLVEAIEHLRAFLADPGTPATRQYEEPAREAIAELDRRIGRVVVRLTPAPADARVTLDGLTIPSAALGRPRLVDPGRHELAATANGYVVDERTFTVAAGESLTVTLKLAPAAAGTATWEPSAAAAPPDDAASPARPSRALPIALMAGGGALLVSGVAIGLVGLSQASDAPSKNGPAASAAKTKGLAGDVLGGVGIASAAIGIILYAVGKPTRSDAARQIAPWTAGAVVGVRISR